MRARLAVGAVVFRDDGAVLLVQRGRPPLEGAWSLPGGKVIEGESFAAAVVREVLEETGLEVEAGAVVAVVTLTGEGHSYEIHEIVCALCSGARPDAIRAGDDARDVRWCEDDEVAALGVSVDVVRVIASARIAWRSPPLPGGG
jgi:acetyl-CoA carboxylase carboxyl transferase subunit beta